MGKISTTVILMVIFVYLMLAMLVVSEMLVVLKYYEFELSKVMFDINQGGLR